ncbi:MAG: ABC transporter ATP-binding protein [Ramlibacter sp.]
MDRPALLINGLSKSFGSIKAIENFDFALRQGEIHALIGPNGAGKSTLVGLIAGDLKHDKGHIQLAGHDVTGMAAYLRPRLGLARSFQVSQLYMEFNAATNVVLAILARTGRTGMLKAVADDRLLQGEALGYLARVDLAARSGALTSDLSHGERRQLEVAMALAQQASVLLLDEPMAGMGTEESAKMTSLISELRGTCSVLLVEHDMQAVFALADRITVLVRGRAFATGTVDEIRANAAVRDAYLGDTDA